jgi:transposase
MKKSTKFSPEVRERAVRLVQQHRGEYPSLWAAIESIAPKIGCVPQTLNEWVRRHEVDTGMRDGVTSDERERIKTLEREVKELRRANEILKLASAFFAQAHSFISLCPGAQPARSSSALPKPSPLNHFAAESRLAQVRRLPRCVKTFSVLEPKPISTYTRAPEPTIWTLLTAPASTSVRRVFSSTSGSIQAGQTKRNDIQMRYICNTANQ